MDRPNTLLRSNQAALGTLEPRYRRVLSSGDVLDESIRLFRQHWITFALVSAVSLIPPGLLDIWQSASGPFTHPLTVDDLRNGRLAQASAEGFQAADLIASAILTEYFGVGWLQILFRSIGAIVYTVLFIDLRNCREGTDMAERLTQLEESPIRSVTLQSGRP